MPPVSLLGGRRPIVSSRERGPDGATLTACTSLLAPAEYLDRRAFVEEAVDREAEGLFAVPDLRVPGEETLFEAWRLVGGRLVRDDGAVDLLLAATHEADADVAAGDDDRAVPAEVAVDLEIAVLDDEDAVAHGVPRERQRRELGGRVGIGGLDVHDDRVRRRAPGLIAQRQGIADRARVLEDVSAGRELSYSLDEVVHGVHG